MMVNEHGGGHPRGQLDEMQVLIRNRIGNQSFTMMFYLLLLNIGLEGFGVRWMPYPVNVFLIMLFCAGCYLVRIVWSGAYAGPGEKNKNRMSIAGATGAALVAAAIVFAQTRLGGRGAQVNSADGGAVVVFVTSIAIMVAVAGTTIAAGAISRWRRGRDEE